MPELPEVETVRLGLAPVLEGRVLARVEARRPDLRVPLPDGFAKRLTGRRVVRLGRRAKYLLAFLDDERVWLVHLGMSGRMVVTPSAAPLDKHDHVVVATDAGIEIRFRDPRRFGLMDLVEPGALEAHPLLAGLGPEPLDESFDGPVLKGRLAGSRSPLKTALLDQRRVAGLGNIYVCEALFRAGLSPLRDAASVTRRQADILAGAIRDVLAEAVAAGGTSLRDHRQADGELGYFQNELAVYGREGEPCPGCSCREGIRRIVQSGRSTFYCPKRQQ
ncbi:MAG: bifunctional DNA-formamidopyrimidine glycosylase/DNA-(apurinic or apyrimidinic site) lyase [Magnetospirillum sp. WYHS-4]